MNSPPTTTPPAPENRPFMRTPSSESFHADSPTNTRPKGRNPFLHSASKESLLKMAVHKNWSMSPGTNENVNSPDVPRTDELSSIGTPVNSQGMQQGSGARSRASSLMERAERLVRRASNAFDSPGMDRDSPKPKSGMGSRKDSNTSFNTFVSYDSPRRGSVVDHFTPRGAGDTPRSSAGSGVHSYVSSPSRSNKRKGSPTASTQHMHMHHLPEFPSSGNLNALIEEDDIPSTQIQNLFHHLSNNEMYIKFSTLEEKLLELGEFKSSLERRALREWVASVQDFKTQQVADNQQRVGTAAKNSVPQSADYIDVNEFNRLMTHGSLIRTSREEMIEAFRLFDVTDLEEIPLDLLRDIYSSWGRFSIGEDANYVMESFVNNEQEALAIEEDRRREQKQSDRHKKKTTKRRDPRKIDYRAMIEELVEEIPYEEKLIFRDLHAQTSGLDVGGDSQQRSVGKLSHSRHSMSMRSLV